LFSACKRCSSSSIGERLPLPGNALEPSASSSCFHHKIRFELMPRRRPASPAEIPCCVNIFTA
jgi:hypothetical protein